MNKATGKPKGTAFVQFADGVAAQRACAACARQRDGGGEGVSMRGKALSIDAALVQDSARALAQKQGGAAKGADRRNLHLVRLLPPALLVKGRLCRALLGGGGSVVGGCMAMHLRGGVGRSCSACWPGTSEELLRGVPVPVQVLAPRACCALACRVCSAYGMKGGDVRIERSTTSGS